MARSKILARRPQAFFFFALALSGAVVGCFRPKAHDPSALNGEELASFTVKSVKGSSAVTTTVDGTDWPQAKLFIFKVCLTERQTTLPVREQTFGVSGANLEARLVRTDASGCLSWQEEFKINYLADEAYLPLTRALEPVDDPHSGRVMVKLAIDPWNFSGKAKEIVDLSNADDAALIPQGLLAQESEIPGRLAGQMKGLAASSRSLTLARFSIMGLLDADTGGAVAASPAAPGVTPSAGDAQAEHFGETLELSVQPMISFQDASKVRVDLGAKTLKMSVDAALVALIPTGAGQPAKRYLAWKSIRAIELAQTSSGAQIAQLPVAFVPLSPAAARYQLLLRISPQATGLGVQPFEGVFELGSHAQLASGGVLPERLSDSNSMGGSFSFDAAMNGLAPLPAASAQQPATPQASPTPDAAPSQEK